MRGGNRVARTSCAGTRSVFRFRHLMHASSTCIEEAAILGSVVASFPVFVFKHVLIGGITHVELVRGFYRIELVRGVNR